MIKATSFIAERDSGVFHGELAAKIEEFQRCGWKVEILYSATPAYFTALIIGRENEKITP